MEFYTFTAQKNYWPKESAFYYLMKDGFILRLEKPLDQSNLPILIKANLLNKEDVKPLTQDQANNRVAIFRDEILEFEDYKKRVFGIVQ